MKKLWQNNGTTLHPMIEKYTVGNDPIVDLEILEWDITGSKAHAMALLQAGILTRLETMKILNCLEEIRLLHSKGQFKIEQSQEDCHTAIENFLTEKLGDAGKKIHTGRSRNDQIATAVRLFNLSSIEKVKSAVQLLTSELDLLCKRGGTLVMPGYTHSQRAMPMPFAVWVGSYISALRDDCDLLEVARKITDYSPLGSAAGFGSPIQLDRKMTATELGFSKVEENVLYCQNSRGKFESATIFALSSIMMTLGKLAQDLLTFSMAEFGFFTLPDELTTGSSMMPNKRNYDTLELIRANVSVVISLQLRVQEISKNLISGYNRDFQLLKEPLIQAFKIVLDSIGVMTLILSNLEIHADKISAACTEELHLTERAYELVAKGVPFRDAYAIVKSGRSKRFWK